MTPRSFLKRLEKAGLTLAVAESYTGGRLQDLLTDVAGSSSVFLGGVVAYADTIKTKQLGVRASLIQKHGAVSPEVAAAMARGVRKALRADVGLSTTGIAGPGGARPNKPVGLSFVAVSTRSGTWVERRVLQGSRLRIKDRGAKQALELAGSKLEEGPKRRRKNGHRA